MLSSEDTVVADVFSVGESSGDEDLAPGWREVLGPSEGPSGSMFRIAQTTALHGADTEIAPPAEWKQPDEEVSPENMPSPGDPPPAADPPPPEPTAPVVLYEADFMEMMD